MNRWFLTLVLVTSGLSLGMSAMLSARQDAGGHDKGVLAIVDGKGATHKTKNWNFTRGTKRLSWLPAAEAAQALEFYEGKGAPLKKSVLTYLPLASIRSIDFDPAMDKEIMTVRVATSAKEADDVILVGPLFYPNFNTLEITATVQGGDKDDAVVEFEGGTRQGSIRSIRFPAPKPIDPLPKGRFASVKHVNMKYPTLQIVDLQVLYVQGDGSWKTLPTLYFNDPSKAELVNISKLTQMRSGGNSYEVTLLSGQKNPRVIVNEPKDAGDVELVGFVGRFSAGYRIFPLVTVGEVLFEDKAKK
jgi:hypothetical protein